MTEINRKAKATMTPFELNHGVCLHYEKVTGDSVSIEWLDTEAYVLEREYAKRGYGGASGDISVYGFSCVLKIDGEQHEIKREVGSAGSCDEPFEIDGVHIWLDAVKCIFDTSFDHRGSPGGFMIEKDFMTAYVCMPRQDARFVMQDVSVSICPETMAHWVDLPRGRPVIEECYNGEDCWMGPYGGKFAHCGLDINMPAGSKLYAPIDFDLQYYTNHVKSGFRNNRIMGERRWSDNSIWRLSSAHIVDALVDEYIPVKRGDEIATTAGTAVGAHEHTHFNLHITEQGGSYFLDPWIIFWQILQDTNG